MFVFPLTRQETTMGRRITLEDQDQDGSHPLSGNSSGPTGPTMPPRDRPWVLPDALWSARAAVGPTDLLVHHC